MTELTISARSENVPAGAAGTVYTISRMLGGTSTLSLAAGTNSNLSLSGSSITAAAGIPTGTTQKAIVFEEAGDFAFRYPVLVTGGTAAPAPTPTPTPSPVLLAIGVRVGAIGHSFVGNNYNGDLSVPARLTVAASQASIQATVASMMPAVRHDGYLAPNLVRMNISSVSGTFLTGDVVTQGSASGVVQAAVAGAMTLRDCTGNFVNGGVGSGSGGSATASIDTRLNVRGLSMGLAGDFLAPQNGFPGVRSRVPIIMGQAQPPRILHIDAAINSLVNGVPVADALAQTKAIVDDAFAHANGGSLILLVHNAAALGAGSGFNNQNARDRIADYNLGLRSALPGWAAAGRIYEVDAFSATIVGRSTFADDLAAFRSGARMGDPLKLPDTLHPGGAGAFAIASEIVSILTPLIEPGDWWKAKYGARTNALPGVNHATTTGLISSGTSVTMQGGSNGVVTGLFIGGPSSASTVVLSVEAGTGSNGAVVGEFIQVITYTKNATAEEQISIQFAASSVGVGVAGNQSWCQGYMPIWHDGADIFFGSEIALSRNYTAICTGLGYNAAGVQPSAKSVFSRAGFRTLLTPQYKLDGTQDPSGNALRLYVGFTAPAGRTGVQVLKIYPKTMLTNVDDPSVAA